MVLIQDKQMCGAIQLIQHFQLVAVIFQLQSLQRCFATHLDWTMVPYVRKSFYKHYKNGLKYILDMMNSYMLILNIDHDMIICYGYDY